MKSRKVVFTALSHHQLRRIASRIGVSSRTSKQSLVSALCGRRESICTLLSLLTFSELKAIASALALPVRKRSKDELVGLIAGDQRQQMRGKILASLRRQGFHVSKGLIRLDRQVDKQELRSLHFEAVRHKRAKSRNGLARKEEELLSWIANGRDVIPNQISPKLVEVVPNSFDELLFRYACLHWSIPVSSGYGRRLRFNVVDERAHKLIGVIGLGDPVFALGPRDEWIGWTRQQRQLQLHRVVDAFVLGAVPPFSHLLFGKLVAMLAASNEVLARFHQKYSGKNGRISGEARDGRIALLTTTSALGRSSVYNRLRYLQELMYVPVGYTKGSGEFQFLNGLYDEMSAFASSRLSPTAKHSLWGSGFRNRREVVRKCLRAAGLDQDLMYHGIQRELFVVPLASNSAAYLRGDDSKLSYHDRPAAALFEYFRKRWLIPRAASTSDYRHFNRDTFRLWNN